MKLRLLAVGLGAAALTALTVTTAGASPVQTHAKSVPVPLAWRYSCTQDNYFTSGALGQVVRACVLENVGIAKPGNAFLVGPVKHLTVRVTGSNVRVKVAWDLFDLTTQGSKASSVTVTAPYTLTLPAIPSGQTESLTVNVKPASTSASVSQQALPALTPIASN
jgi:hypothetical protein